MQMTEEQWIGMTIDKKAIREVLDKASSMYQYEVVGNPDTFDQYNAGWQDAVDYISQLLGFVD